MGDSPLIVFRYSARLGLRLVSRCKRDSKSATGCKYTTVFTAYEYLIFHHCTFTYQVWARVALLVQPS